MSSIFDGVTAQYVDENGKVRALVYSSITLFTSPLPPSDLRVIREIESLPVVSVNEARRFARAKNLEVESQDVVRGETEGLWVKPNVANSPIYYGYVPVKPVKVLKDLEEVRKDPLRTDDNSKLSDMRRDRKLASVLKQYVLWEYSQDPEGFSEDSFTVDADHVYDLRKVGNKFSFNDTIYDTEQLAGVRKIIVPTEDVRGRLMYHLQVSLLNDRAGVMAMKNKKSLEGMYQNISDFRTRDEEIIFSNVANIVRWKFDFDRNQRNNSVMYRFLPEFKEPYFYRNIKIKKGKLVIIQNVEKGELDTAIAVSEKWKKDRVNIGYSPEKPDTDTSYNIYTETGLSNTVRRKKDGVVDIVEYENGQYGALLSL